MGAGASSLGASLGTTESPCYVVRRLGSRHLLFAGGGGPSKTGVHNQIECYLLNYTKIPGRCSLTTELTAKVDTTQYATMSMDVVCVARPNAGRFLFALAHDDYCQLYETTHFSAAPDTRSLSFDFRPVIRFRTHSRPDASVYQTCTRFDHSVQGMRLVTGGSDGRLKVWNTKEIVDNRNPGQHIEPTHELTAHTGDVKDVDIAPSGRWMITVGNSYKEAFLWDLEQGRKVSDVPKPASLAAYVTRSMRFLPYQRGNSVDFVVAYNPLNKGSKNTLPSMIALIAFLPTTASFSPIDLKAALPEAISSLAVSPVGDLIGCGGMLGSVAVFDALSLRQLLRVRQAHSSFVTSVEFLDRAAHDVVSASSGGRLPPGAAASSRGTIISVSADKFVKYHEIGFNKGMSVTGFVLVFSVVSLIVYWLLFVLL